MIDKDSAQMVGAESLDERLNNHQQIFARLAERATDPILAARLAGKSAGIQLARQRLADEAAFYAELDGLEDNYES